MHNKSGTSLVSANINFTEILTKRKVNWKLTGGIFSRRGASEKKYENLGAQ